MKKSRFTDSQIMDALKRAEAGFKVPDLCRELGISSALFYRWRAKVASIVRYKIYMKTMLALVLEIRVSIGIFTGIRINR
jgi:hypothetical protein